MIVIIIILLYIISKAWCTIIRFLVRLSISRCFPFVYYKNVPKYLTGRETAKVFIYLTRFLLNSLVSSSFLVLLRYFLSIFSFISSCLMVSASNISKYFIFFQTFRIFLIWLFYSFRHLPLFILSMTHFSMPNSIPIFWLYILTASIKVSKTCSCLAVFVVDIH